MKEKKKYFVVLLIIILYVSLLLLPNAIDFIPSEAVKRTIVRLLFVLVLLFLIWTTYRDIRCKEYTTRLYIVLLDMIGIINIVVFYYFFMIWNSNELDIETLLFKNEVELICLFIGFITSILLNYLQKDKFLKKV